MLYVVMKLRLYDLARSYLHELTHRQLFPHQRFVKRAKKQMLLWSSFM